MTRTITRTAAKAASLAAAALLATTLLSAPAGAFSGEPVTLVGAVSCDSTTGHQIITWTLDNPSGSSLTISQAAIDQGGLSTGSSLDEGATLTPNPLASGLSATAATAATGDATGDLHLVVTYTFADQDPLIDGEVVLPGGCVKVDATTTTTTVATTTTTKAAAAAAVASAPAFTG